MPIDQIIRLSISEAAKLFGVNSQTIRRAIQNNEFNYIVVQGRYKINFESLIKWSQRRTTIKNKMEVRGIGQYVDRWKIKNKLYSPNPQIVGTDHDNNETAGAHGQQSTKTVTKTENPSVPTLPI